MKSETLDRPFGPVIDPDEGEREETIGVKIEAPKPAKRTRKPIDRGSAGSVRYLGFGRYEVESFRKRGEYYTVDLNARDGRGTCSCRDHERRGRVCKHIEIAALDSYVRAMTTARQMTEDELYDQIRRSHIRPEQRQACVDTLSLKYL